jgi:surfactin synthase thioesterase subunit
MKLLSALIAGSSTAGRDDRSARPVVMLPYAGAMGSPAAVIRPGLPPDAVAYTVSYPGHGRTAGPLLDDPEPLLELIEADLLELAESAPAPVLVGLSMGGRLAYELARRAAERGAPPAGLVLCMARPPHTGIGHRPIAGLPDQDFGPAAAQLALVRPELLSMAGAESMLRVLRADLAIVERVPTVAGPALAVPTTVVGAAADWLVPEPALRRWADLVVEPVHLRISGGHLEWLAEPGEMAAAVAAGIVHALGPAGEFVTGSAERG